MQAASMRALQRHFLTDGSSTVQSHSCQDITGCFSHLHVDATEKAIQLCKADVLPPGHGVHCGIGLTSCMTAECTPWPCNHAVSQLLSDQSEASLASHWQGRAGQVGCSWHAIAQLLSSCDLRSPMLQAQVDADLRCYAPAVLPLYVRSQHSGPLELPAAGRAAAPERLGCRP
jgi:hypothetical protein